VYSKISDKKEYEVLQEGYTWNLKIIL
jgi:hypothetical protein